MAITHTTWVNTAGRLPTALGFRYLRLLLPAQKGVNKQVLTIRDQVMRWLRTEIHGTVSTP